MGAEENKLTLIAGASTDPSRYAYTAALFLSRQNFPFLPIGIKKGSVLGQDILPLRERPKLEGIHTITMYMNARNQQEWEAYFLSLQPKRIIFNPGAENPAFAEQAENLGITCINACTLVMINTGQY
ncbi:CoA-binding protein [Algoriphagus aestuarii]|nr:CoA-binding protein [Algoriphagus aestuarii]